MPDPLTTALIATGSSLITILLTSKLQHLFWKYQKRAELRLTVINEFNRLTAEFITGHIAASATYTPSQQWFTAFSITEANIRALFSQEAFDAYKEVEILVGPGGQQRGLGSQGQYGVHDFLDRKNAAMRQFYKELSLL